MRTRAFKTIKLDPNDFKGCVIFAPSGLFSRNENKISIILKDDTIYINSIPDGPGKLLVGEWTPKKILNEILSNSIK